jgi:molybdopterin-guanine dinucleotide biosynthesis protein A
MGRDKALLQEAGIPLLERVAGVVSQAAGNCTIVAPAGRYEGLGVPVLADLWPGEGPLGGILTVLESDAAEWNLIVAVDMPFLDTGFLTGLFVEARKGGETVVPVHADGGVEPLCGVYHAGALPRLRTFFQAGGRRVKDALREIALRTVPAPERILANINTPEQWEAART